METMLEGGGLELTEGVADKPVTMPGILELEGTIIVENRLDAILGGAELELEVTVNLGTGIVP